MNREPGHLLRAGEPVRAGLLRVAAVIIGQARERIAHPSADRAEDIHIVRTSIKRLRALLRLVRPVIGKVRFRRENGRLRNAARLLAAARERTIAQRTLATLGCSARHAREKPAFAAALAGFKDSAVHEAVAEKALAQVARRLALIGGALRGLRFSASGWPALEPGLRATYAQGRKRMHAACSGRDDPAFHRWRIRVKNLHYQLQFLQPIWPKHLGRWIARLDELQDRLGDDHDLVVVERLLCAAPETFGGAAQVERVVRHLRKRSQKLRRASKPAGRAVFQEKPDALARKMGRRWPRWSRPPRGVSA